MIEEEKRKRQYKKELNSLKNKMGRHIVWFNSLCEKNQYDVLFAWKNQKHLNKVLYQPITTSKFKIKYLTNFKYFILKMRRKFKPSKSKIRESAIDLVLDKK